MSICPSDLLTLTVAYQGQPFVHLQAYGIDTLELDTAFQGQPFIAQPYYEDCEVIDPPEPEPPIIEPNYSAGGGGYLVELDAKPKKRGTITLYNEEEEILELLAIIMPVIHEQERNKT